MSRRPYKGRRGHPVLLDKAYWREMLDLPAEAMPRAVIQGAREKLRLVEVDEKGVVMDIDTRGVSAGVGVGVLTRIQSKKSPRRIVMMRRVFRQRDNSFVH